MGNVKVSGDLNGGLRVFMFMCKWRGSYALFTTSAATTTTLHSPRRNQQTRSPQQKQTSTCEPYLSGQQLLSSTELP